MELRLGFDETPAKERIATARRELLLTLSAYLLASIAAAFLLSRLLARPVRQLQAASREIASGNLATQLTVPTGIREMGALAADLDTMRSALVGTTLRLQQQMEERVTLEAQLRHKQRLETVGTLAGGIAHEINNVLVPITLRTEMAMDALPPEHPAYADLAVVLGASRRARDTVSKVLSFARHFDISPPQHLNIAPAVEEALHLIHTVKPASVNVVADIDHNCGDVLADSGSIVHIVLNLCSNALQAMHDAGGQLLVRLDQYAAADRKYTRLQVIDNGPGMDAATQERMFEPFFTTREVGMGTGLGLAVVHGIATALNASIQVQSAPQRGTTFAVLFPC
jgi:signal transduction histidine kinase